MKKALIVFTRVPMAGRTKTRLMPYFTADECAEIHTAFLMDIAGMASNLDTDVFIAYDGRDAEPLETIFGDSVRYFRQDAGALGPRMSAAIKRVFDLGYGGCVLIGTDVPYAKSEDIERAFSALAASDLVFGPTEDGGYWLVGGRRHIDEIFRLEKYSHDHVMADTIASIPGGMTYSLMDMKRDVDEIGDLEFCRAASREDSSTGRFLAERHVISVIIPVYNEAKGIGNFVDELKKMNGRCEVIFVDGGSTDDTVKILCEDGYRVISAEKGRGIQMNAGVRVARGDILWFLHADAELPDDTIGEINDVMRGYDVGCFGIAFHSKNFFMWTNRVISNRRAHHGNIVFGDQGMFIKKKLFADMGMFPEIPLMEDYRFSLNLKQKNIHIGMTKHRLYVSDRRYEGSTIDKLLVMKKMYLLRRRYLAGEDIDKIVREYRDIR